MIFNALAETNEGTTPTAEDLKGWADTYGLTLPVIADEGWAINSRYEQDGGIPTITVIGPGAEVLLVDDYTWESKLDGLLPE